MFPKMGYGQPTLFQTPPHLLSVQTPCVPIFPPLHTRILFLSCLAMPNTFMFRDVSTFTIFSSRSPLPLSPGSPPPPRSSTYGRFDTSGNFPWKSLPGGTLFPPCPKIPFPPCTSKNFWRWCPFPPIYGAGFFF